MKRHIAKKKHSNNCMFCNKPINKGNVYYLDREVFEEDGRIYAYTFKICAKCKYDQDNHKERFERFKPNCHHPITDLIWTYIPGECVKQPDHDECMICGKWI